ncbi:MAG: lasso peptide biosynthesis PqqD family chaperone [Streptosporangiaceae bacterium]|nr:lasso peptide biosynthesis PqqD family chaperone [Streptosporangiaceae bacterium]MBV9853576.1 lasso peptide biosynthesis PqqD family chaperone [Streptosporangiaceae bacterium]
MINLAGSVAFTETEYGGVLLDERAGRYWQLNGVGTLALKTMLSGGDTSTATAAVCERYDAAPETARMDIAALVAELREARLIIEV